LEGEGIRRGRIPAGIRAQMGGVVKASPCCSHQASHERDACSAEAESMAAQLSSKARECDTFQSTLVSEQRRIDELLQVCVCVCRTGHNK